MTQPTFEARPGKRRLGRKRWHVVLIGGNGEVLSTSESLNSKDAVEVNVAAQREAAAVADLHWPE